MQGLYTDCIPYGLRECLRAEECVSNNYFRPTTVAHISLIFVRWFGVERFPQKVLSL